MAHTVLQHFSNIVGSYQDPGYKIITTIITITSIT
jgi:hypothetical protein